MKNSKAFTLTGLLLIAAALLLTCYNIITEINAGKVSDKILSEIGITPNEGEEEVSFTEDENGNKLLEFKRYPDYVLNPDMEMPVITVDGLDYIGVISIPSLEISLPVLKDWTYAGLRKAPGRYSGSVYKNDLIICAHNYSTHFGGIKNLKQGSAVIFTDTKGNVFPYSVTEVVILQPTAIEEMIDENYGLTLFTCTIGGRTRVTLRCEKMW